MSKKEIEPQYKNLVMDLVKLAGVDVSDWQNYEGADYVMCLKSNKMVLGVLQNNWN